MCNALCLGCVRTDMHFNHKKSIIPDKQYILFDTFKKILTAPDFQSVVDLEFCGTIDDPLMHPEFLEFLDWASTVKKYNILIHTNASLRNTEYWTKLATVLKQHRNHVVKFSIDGLEDTNHLYRQNTTWKKIMENAEAFIAAGGRAFWQYLIFPWNEHQINEAKELSVKMGFVEFASRHDRSVATSLGLAQIQKIKVENITKKKKVSNVDDINNSLLNTVNDDIACNYGNRKMFFIGYDSKLWPCCFIQNGFVNTDEGKRALLQQRLFDAYGSDDWNNLEKHSVAEVLSHSFYSNDLVESWSSNVHGTGKTDRIHRCTEVCSVKKLEKLPIGGYKVL